MPMPAHALQATSLGYGVVRETREPVTLRVHSRFRHALNLRTAGGSLLTLLGNGAGNFPTGIRVALPAHWDWRNAAADGMPVVQRDRALCTSAWQVDLSGAAAWQPRALSAELNVSARWRLSALHQRAARRLRAHVAAQAFCGHCLALLPQWPHGARNVALGPYETPHALADEVRSLIGYGAGLTPEGDDYLLGYLAALWPWRNDPAAGAHRRDIAAAVQDHLHATTDISRHYLQLGVSGHFSEPIVALLHTFAGSAADTTWSSRVDAVLQFGASSGADTLAGMLHGVRTLHALAHDTAASAAIDEVRPLNDRRQP
jgi:hypothetical protein